jgi:hypothetical protein
LNTGLYKLIEEGEHQQQDFKFCINDSKKIAKSLVAFANTDGGRLLIGVKDNGKVAGIRTDEEYYMVESAAKIFSDPAIPFITKQWHSEGKTVLEISVSASEKKPHLQRMKVANGSLISVLKMKMYLAHKIQLVTWKKLNSPRGIYFTYSDDEKFLLNICRNMIPSPFQNLFDWPIFPGRRQKIFLVTLLLWMW